MEIDTLNISEDFYSVQGEGHTSGVPAYFIRLRACNLMCGGADGSLMKEGKATWWCDTEAVWRKGLQKPFFKLLQQWEHEGIDKWIYDGRIHLIWTGGEPTIPKQQKAIVNFFKYWGEQDNLFYVYNEIETNGTKYITDELFELLDQINSSPKLSNAGMPRKMTRVPEAIERIMEHHNYQFKFVISNEEDIEEIFSDFIIPFNIPLKNVVCMPGLDSQEDFHERTEWVLEMSKIYKFRGLTRLHISAWDKTLNV